MTWTFQFYKCVGVERVWFSTGDALERQLKRGHQSNDVTCFTEQLVRLAGEKLASYI